MIGIWTDIWTVGIDQFPIHILNILNIPTLLILVRVSQYFASKKYPACNFKMNESPQNKFIVFSSNKFNIWKKKSKSSPNHCVGFWGTYCKCYFKKYNPLYFFMKCWHTILFNLFLHLLFSLVFVILDLLSFLSLFISHNLLSQKCRVKTNSLILFFL